MRQSQAVVARPRIQPADVDIGRLFDLVSDAVVIGDATSGSIVLWNDAATSIFGYTTEEAIGMPIEDLVPGELKEAHRRGLASYRSHGRAPLIDQRRTVELPASAKDGRMLWVELSLSGLPDTAYPGLVLALIRDVTERRQAQEEARLAHESLRDFLAMAAHDLRTPLGTIKNAATLLVEHLDPAKPAGADLTGMIARQADRLLHLMDNLLMVASLDARVLQVSATQVRLDNAIRSAVETVGADHDVELGEGIDATVQVDTDQLERILVNLLTNAQHHGAPPILIDARPVGSWVEVRIRDHGPGVPPQLVSQLFARFVRGNDSTHRGSGLGTAIAIELARLNGGDVRYEANRPRGACFIVSLPVA